MSAVLLPSADQSLNSSMPREEVLMLKKTTLAVGLAAALLSALSYADDDHDRDHNRQGIPELQHVFLIMMENHSASEIIGNTANAPFINQYAHSANLATNYFAVGHPSLP